MEHSFKSFATFNFKVSSGKFIHNHIIGDPEACDHNIIMNVATTVKGMEDAWPSDIEDSYDRIRLLGEGGFGKVWLAKKTGRPSPQATDTPREYDEDEEEYVAIKQIGIKRQIQDRKFIAREIAILRELHHPNIIQCLNSANLPNSTLVVLTLAYGPNLGDIVRYGGAVSVSLARLVSRQLISAVAYLHGRGE
jgi:serine/threonine protein kinase